MFDIAKYAEQFINMANYHIAHNYFELDNITIFNYCACRLSSFFSIEPLFSVPTKQHMFWSQEGILKSDLYKLTELSELIKYDKLAFRNAGRAIIIGVVTIKKQEDYYNTKEYDVYSDIVMKAIIHSLGWYHENDRKIKAFGKIYSNIERLFFANGYELTWFDTEEGVYTLIRYDDGWDVVSIGK